MKSELLLLQKVREHFYNYSQKLTHTQLTTIPQGFRNNAMWNICHTLVTQHLLTYARCGLAIELDENLVSGCRKGSSPADWKKAMPFDEACAQLLPSATKLSQDYNNGLFVGFQSYGTSYGVTLHSIEDAICFNNAHENLHLGYLMAMLNRLP